MLKRLVIHSFPVNPPFCALAKCSTVLNLIAVLNLVAALQLQAGTLFLPGRHVALTPSGSWKCSLHCSAGRSNYIAPNIWQPDPAGLPNVVIESMDFYFLRVTETNTVLESAWALKKKKVVLSSDGPVAGRKLSSFPFTAHQGVSSLNWKRADLG